MRLTKHQVDRAIDLLWQVRAMFCDMADVDQLIVASDRQLHRSIGRYLDSLSSVGAARSPKPSVRAK